MRTTTGFILGLILYAAPVIAADGWSLSVSNQATRRVVVTLSVGSRQVEQWVLPVAHNASPVKDDIEHRWITLPQKSAKGFPRKIFTDTWLGSVDADEAWVRVAWWPNEQRDGKERLTNSYIATKYKTTQTLQLESGMQIIVSYEDKG